MCVHLFLFDFDKAYFMRDDVWMDGYMIDCSGFCGFLENGLFLFFTLSFFFFKIF